MGYEDTDELLRAIGKGDLVVLKVAEGDRLKLAEWLHGHSDAAGDGEVAKALEDIAAGLELSLELERYPAGSDICDLDLPHGWPSYCDRSVLEG
jgi:hypothetical protein